MLKVQQIHPLASEKTPEAFGDEERKSPTKRTGAQCTHWAALKYNGRILYRETCTAYHAHDFLLRQWARGTESTSSSECPLNEIRISVVFGQKTTKLAHACAQRQDSHERVVGHRGVFMK